MIRDISENDYKDVMMLGGVYLLILQVFVSSALLTCWLNWTAWYFLFQTHDWVLIQEMNYETIPKGRGVVYRSGNKVYVKSRAGRDGSVIYLACTKSACPGTAKLSQGLLYPTVSWMWALIQELLTKYYFLLYVFG